MSGILWDDGRQTASLSFSVWLWSSNPLEAKLLSIEMVEGDEEQKKDAKVAQWKGCAYICTVLGSRTGKGVSLCAVLGSMTRKGRGVPICAWSWVLGQERVCLYVHGPAFHDYDRKKKSKRVNENPNEFGIKSQFANLKMSGLNKCLVLNPFGIDSEYPGR